MRIRTEKRSRMSSQPSPAKESATTSPDGNHESTPSAAHHLSASSLSIAYDTGHGSEALLAVDELDFSIARGEFVCIVGPSGCGKTTFLDAVAGFIPVSAGELTLAGAEIVKPGPDRAMVFQQPNLLPWRKVLHNVTYGLEMAGIMRGAKAEERAKELLTLVGLGDFIDSYPRQLSGGMRQRVNLARALAVEPNLLLLDEPFASVDAQTRETLQNELLRIRERTNFSALFVTHDISESVFLGDRVCIFSPRPGRVSKEIVIDLPKPRTADIRRDPKFIGYVEEIAMELMTASSSVGRSSTTGLSNENGGR
jgi:NitT/TauT family transport system ATP-binding protein